MPDTNDLSNWGQFGLAGLIIGAFMIGWAYIGKHFIDRWKKSDDEKQALLLATMAEAKSDRDKFTSTIEKINDRTIVALNENTKAIESLREQLLR